MGKFYDEIPDQLLGWIQKQHMFWVASAPLSGEGHINVSPKGTADCFHVANSKQVWYEDLSGSGIETISHIRENGRITIMFSAFDGPPRILRLFGVGSVHEYGTPEYHALIPAETRKPGSRAVVVVDVHRVGTSCGYAVPIYNFVKHRTALLMYFSTMENGDRKLAASGTQPGPGEVAPANDTDNFAAKGVDTPPYASLRTYWLLKNMRSVDGLPGLDKAPDSILRLTPQSRFDKDGGVMMHQNGGANDLQGKSVIGDPSSFASGLVCGAVAVLVFTVVLGRLRQ